MAYKELSTTKYWQASAMSELAQAKKDQTSQSIRSFNLFLVAYLIIMGCIFVINHPDWIQPTLTYVEQTGILDQLRTLFA